MSIVEPLNQLIAPRATLVASDSYFWSPRTCIIAYDPESVDTLQGSWSLLHEAGHALLEHKDYTLDTDLLMMEVAAWDQASHLACKLNVQISPEHVQNCLDSYRGWLHNRSKCPNCSTTGLQSVDGAYLCLNCQHSWKVSASLFCRKYRMSNKKSPA